MSKKTVLPGDEVAVAEEFMPAEGTYEQDGKILSSLAGELELDQEEKIAKVSPKNPLVTLKNGDSVFCRITDVRASMAICDIFAAEGKDRDITGETSATIHISKLSSEYVQDVGRESVRAISCGPRSSRPGRRCSSRPRSRTSVSSRRYAGSAAAPCQAGQVAEVRAVRAGREPQGRRRLRRHQF